MKNPIRQNTLANIKYVFLFVLVTTVQNASGEIKNGYEPELHTLRESLQNLQAILNDNKTLAGSQRRKIEAKIASIERTLSYHELTENLLDQFKTIAPDLYLEIDTIKDAKGRPVDVYVAFVPTDGTEMKAWGTTYIGQAENDQDAYQSEYGAFSVSVKIWIVSKALLVLSHELGHVRYQVPHLASYVDYYKKRYKEFDDYDYVGHDSNDPSGQSASQFEKRFQKEYANFLKITNERLENPLALMDRIRKKRALDI